MKVITLNLVFTFIAISLFPSDAFADRFISYRVGDYTYDVPSENVISEGFLVTLRSLIGLDSKTDSFLFKVNGVISGGIYATSPNERVGYESTDRFEQFWYAKSQFSDREIILHLASGYYLGFDSVGYRGMFTVYKIFPDKDKKIPKSRKSIYIAECNGSSVYELKNVTCNRQIILGDILVQYSFLYKDLAEVFELENEVVNSISAWRRKK